MKRFIKKPILSSSSVESELGKYSKYYKVADAKDLEGFRYSDSELEDVFKEYDRDFLYVVVTKESLDKDVADALYDEGIELLFAAKDADGELGLYFKYGDDKLEYIPIEYIEDIIGAK